MTPFRRLVLELGHGAADPETMRQAAAFARLLDAELHALFVEDETLLNASALPFTREISPVSYRWRPLDPARLEADLRVAADRARRHVAEAAGAIGVRQNFEVRRGDLGLYVAEICVASDVVVVSPPRGMANGNAHGFRRLRDTVRRSPASVLFLPPGPGRGHGLIVGIVSGAADPSLAVARRIAAHGKEGLLLLASAPMAADIGDTVVRPIPGMAAPDLIAALGDTRERLIVMTRGRGKGEEGADLSAARGVAVLEVEPD